MQFLMSSILVIQNPIFTLEPVAHQDSCIDILSHGFSILHTCFATWSLMRMLYSCICLYGACYTLAKRQAHRCAKSIVGTNHQRNPRKYAQAATWMSIIGISIPVGEKTGFSTTALTGSASFL